MRHSKLVKTACVCKLCLVILTAAGAPSSAKAASPFPALPKAEHEVDWIALFGDLNPGTDPKTGIPVDRHTIKHDVSNVLSGLCEGTGVQPSDMKLYRVDFNGDHLPDYWSDWSRFTPCQAVCDTVNGCYASGYVARTPQQIFPAPPPASAPVPNTCPLPGNAPPEANTQCIDTCDAAIEQCPGLFSYMFHLAWNDKVREWNIYDPAVFGATYRVSRMSSVWRALSEGEGREGDGRTVRYPYYPANAGTVVGLTLDRARGHCTQEEVVINRGECIKYYQWVSDSSGNFGNGYWKDLYVPDSADGFNDRREMYNFTAFNIASRVLSRGELAGNGTGLRFGAHTWFGIQVPDFDADNNPTTPGQFVCWEFQNNSNSDYFVPTQTDAEINAWRAGLPAGVTSRPCRLRFSDWEGTLSCASVAPACDQTINIVAERHCQRSTSSYTACGECIAASVPQGAIRGCEFEQVCYGEPCPAGGGDGGGASEDDDQ